jgi:hypothetical protein
MTPEARTGVLRALDQVWQAARGPRAATTPADLELMREYALRIVDSVVEDEVARRPAERGGA